MSADICLVAVGRGPVTDGLGSRRPACSTPKGFVKVDGQLRTTVAARVGRRRRRPRRRCSSPTSRSRRESRWPSGSRASTCPTIDYVEHPARHLLHARDRERRAHRGPGAASRATTSSSRSSTSARSARPTSSGEGGIVKVVAEAGDGPVLGVHMIGPHVTDLDRRGHADHELGGLAEPTSPRSSTRTRRCPKVVGEAMLALAGKSLAHRREEERGDHTYDIGRRRRASRPLPDEQLREILHLLKLAPLLRRAAWRRCTARDACRARSTPAADRRARTSAWPSPSGRDDSLFPTHRDLTAQLAKGLDLKRVMAQFWGRIDGYTARARRQQPHRRLGRQPHVHGDVAPADRLPGRRRGGARVSSARATAA